MRPKTFAACTVPIAPSTTRRYAPVKFHTPTLLKNFWITSKERCKKEKINNTTKVSNTTSMAILSLISTTKRLKLRNKKFAAGMIPRETKTTK